MKILHVNDNYSDQGGVEKYMLEVSCLLAQHGHSNIIFYTNQQKNTIRNGAWPAYHIQPDKNDHATQIKNIIAKEQPDAVYIHHVASPLLVETLTDILPSVAYVHGFTPVCPGLAKYYRRGNMVCERKFDWGCVPMHLFRRC